MTVSSADNNTLTERKSQVVVKLRQHFLFIFRHLFNSSSRKPAQTKLNQRLKHLHAKKVFLLSLSVIQ